MVYNDDSNIVDKSGDFKPQEETLDGQNQTSNADPNNSRESNEDDDEEDAFVMGINEATLLQNLNQGLFAELHTLTLKELNEAFE